jgi:hypothetical protein
MTMNASGQTERETERAQAVLAELGRQVEHWRLAAERLAAPDAVASPAAWASIEHYLGVSLRATIAAATDQLRKRIALLAARLQHAGPADVPHLRAELVAIRRLYLRTETTVDFFADAIATRSTEPMGSWLRACDHLARRAMAEVLQPLGRQVPAALTFADKGAGAAIWKMGLRLWDGSVNNPVAAIKMTRHNLLRPTALLHEAGHQIAHILGWTEQLRAALTEALHDRPDGVARMWAAWASEIAGDAFAFAFAGYGAVSALHDVVDGDGPSAFLLIPGDPHPVAHLRVLLGVAMCRRAFGAGRWDRLARAWTAAHPLALADRETRRLIEASLPALPAVVEATLYRPCRAFGNRALADAVDPRRVSPQALDALERDLGPGGYHSRYWIWDEAIRLLALTAYRTTGDATSLREGVARQDAVMRRLGLQLAA